MRYISVTKPGIIFGNVITLAGGFFLGAHNSNYQNLNLNNFANFLHCLDIFVLTLIGMALVIASGCVFNNYIDRDIDKLMSRTKDRVSVTGSIGLLPAMIYAVFLGALGFLVLYWATNLITLLMAFIGFFVYVIVYSLFAKRTSIHGTAIGGISGAMSIVVGYCAATGKFDIGALILFFIVFFWQIPHSYAIAIFRFKDYKAAGIPVLPVKLGVNRSKISILFYILSFFIVSLLPYVFGLTGSAYFMAAVFSGVFWIYYAILGFKVKPNTKDAERLNIIWARKIFFISILNIMLLSVMMLI